MQANDVSFGYDIDGIRNAKSKNGVTIDCVTDKNRSYAQVILEEQNNTPVASYSYGDDLISQNVNGNTSYFGYDGLGSTKFLTNQAGQITDSYQYDVYGEITTKTGNTDNIYLYTGEQYDRSLNQYYLRARYYNQGVGRFTQMDTWQGKASNPTTLNKYLYADANPVMNIDPSGHMSLGSVMSGLNIRANLSSAAIRGLSHGGSAAARVLGIGSGSTSSAAGGMAIANRLGLRYFKTALRNCKGKRNDFCNYAKGFVEAHVKIRLLVATTPNSARNRKRNKVYTVAGAFDYKKGIGVAAFNGQHRSSSTRLRGHALKMGVKIGDCIGTSTVGRCAEFRATDKLLFGGTRVKNIRWTWAYEVDKNPNSGYLVLGKRKDYCDACQHVWGLIN
ncbi:RHS repeat-associated core domain-containing protein [Psychrobacter sp. I-STPA6b]|uniref:RHS repeat-associated core domain-containing protein n=1 Tax=Psychrobacter sp. I-STPA6b TaxID=2585718 RepID=UPI001D0C3DA8|nr:RHS repeat-associated core domain-containing protein [Psychrobacter sp. I-STPA6b]